MYFIKHVYFNLKGLKIQRVLAGIAFLHPFFLDKFTFIIRYIIVSPFHKYVIY